MPYSKTSCRPLGSRKLATPRPSNRSGRDTSFSRPSRKTSQPVDLLGLRQRVFHGDLARERGEIAVAHLHLDRVRSQAAVLEPVRDVLRLLAQITGITRHSAIMALPGRTVSAHSGHAEAGLYRACCRSARRPWAGDMGGNAHTRTGLSREAAERVDAAGFGLAVRSRRSDHASISSEGGRNQRNPGSPQDAADKGVPVGPFC